MPSGMVVCYMVWYAYVMVAMSIGMYANDLLMNSSAVIQTQTKNEKLDAHLKEMFASTNPKVANTSNSVCGMV